MKNLKNIVAALTITATLAMTATVANAGIIYTGRAESDVQCKESTTLKDSLRNVSGIITVVFPEFNGIIYTGRTEADTENCQTEGIIYTG